MILSPTLIADREALCVKICGIEHFDVVKVFDCGQCFRFDPVPNSKHAAEFSGVAFGRFVSFAQDADTLYIYNSDERDFEDIWKSFLGLDVDYSLILSDISSRSSNPALHSAMDFGKGIRILRQEPWEAICSFIISQNNNIPRIKKIIGALSERCGEPIDIPEALRGHVAPNTVLYSFPTPEALSELGVDGLFELKTGFRAKYIYDAAMKASAGQIDYALLCEESDTSKCVEHLCKIKGVGPKVASCALLFGFARYDAFPIDVWIKRVIEKYFSDGAGDFSPDMLGPYAGIAQQYLFYYERYR
ncbi:MAG: DNA-3-methyladenine glycosylase 2 family protein [Ruminococcaceae bacterium]|nr:DNA-3-methyladenine glycosylase 2 family protein [Oscillospiraceae bacterium]